MALQNQSLAKGIKEAQILRDRALKNENIAIIKFTDIQKKLQNNDEERRKAERKAYTAENAFRSSKSTYKTLFIGNMILTLIIAFFVAYGKREVFIEMGYWFVLRAQNIKVFFLGLNSLYIGAVKGMNSSWKIPIEWCYVIAIIFFIIMTAAAIFFLKMAYVKLKSLLKRIYDQFEDPLFKGLVSADITLAMFYVCLFFSKGIGKLVPMNIMSIWLILSFTGCMIWTFPEIREGMKNEFQI